MARSIIGFHYGPGGNKNGIGDLMRKLNQHKIPFFMKGVDDAGICYEAQELSKTSGVENWLMYRLSTTGQGDGYDYDVPDYNKSPLEAAKKHFEKTVAKWPRELDPAKVWMEPINEPRAKASPEDTQWGNLHPTDYLGKFMLEFAKIANAQGYKVSGPAFNSGEPEIMHTNDYELPGMLAYMRYCAANKEMASLAIHEYVWRRYKDNESWDDWYPHLFGRVEAAFAAADKHGISRDFHVFITEWGFEHTAAPHWSQAERHLTDYNNWAARWPQIKGAASWTLQSGWDGVDNDVASWIKPLADYTVNKNFDPGPQPAQTHKQFGSTKPNMVPVQTAPVTAVRQAGNNAAEAAGFTSSIDLTSNDLVPNQTITATWTFKNSGTSTWDGNYRFAYTDENHPETEAYPRAHFAPATSYALTDIGAPPQVRPGEQVSLTLQLTVPSTGGMFGTNWQLQAPDGRAFGPVRWARANVVPARGQQGDYDVAFVSFHNTVINYESMAPGETFIATWKLRNAGMDAWSGDFRIANVTDGHPETVGRTPLQFGQGATLSQLAGVSQVAAGQEVTIKFQLSAPQQPGSYALHWQLQTAAGAPFGGVRWMKVGVVEASQSISTPSTGAPAAGGQVTSSAKGVQFGMNVNINGGHPLDVDRLKGMAWVRYVLWASRIGKTPQQAYKDVYRNIIQSYAAQGTRSLIILHQDTHGGNAPWMNNGSWDQYANSFAQACAEVAQACAEFGDMVALQIYNEVDSGYGADAGYANPSAIGIAPGNYALILDRSVKAIRAVNPNITIVMSGMKTGPDNAINYIKDVQRAMGGRIGADAIAYHPYGRYINFDPFYGEKFGTMPDAFNLFRNAFPGVPLWITEIGIANDTPLGPEHYEKIGRYISEVVNEVAKNQGDLIPVLTWFAWSDVMREAGIIDRAGNMKAHIGDAYREMIALSAP